MANNCLLYNLDIDFLLNQKEVTIAKQKIDKLSTGSIYFTINLTETIRKSLFENLGLDLTNIHSIPMRWIKGDTHPHVDRSSSSDSFSDTYLAYLTDSPGELIVDGTSYPISKCNAYVFSEGLSHETVGTGSEPRLLLGPMNENGISVGTLPTTISENGETETIYIKYTNANDIVYKINNGGYVNLGFPVTIINTNTDYILKVLFENDLVLSSNNAYFDCDSNNIQFGSTSLNSDGTKTTITIVGVPNYPGLIRNGSSNNIYVYNIHVASNGSTLNERDGWIGQQDWEGANNYIINCSSDGDISDFSGGIIGEASGQYSQSSLYLYGCSSSGSIGPDAGGIVGAAAGYNGGNVICEKCWSTGSIEEGAGGIFGGAAGRDGGKSTADSCYSNGNTSLVFGGGIFGISAGYNNGSAIAKNCYSTGNIASTSGGIFGAYAGKDGGLGFGTTTAINCYSSGTHPTDQGIFGADIANGSNPNGTNCYAANGTWNSSTANASLTGTPNPIVGTTWVATIPGQPYELNNMGYSPYTITNISSTSSLVETYSVSVNSGGSSSPAIIAGKSYTILQKSGGDPSSYGTITMNDNTGIVSTTSETKSGTYTITMRNTGSYNITSFSLTVTQNVIPNVPICFPAGTLVLTDQGEIAIEKIDTKTHTIRGQKIVAITESIPDDSYLVCIEKSSLSYNVPNRRTIISKDHKIMCDKKLVRAEYLIQYIPTIYRIPYNKEKLYNVLLKDYSTMSVNNLVVETMNPKNILAKIYAGNYTTIEKNKMIKILNKLTIQERKKSLISRNMDMA